jgi:phthiocerol/phenolphthiocerol synthesis type-I polyketide synthase D
MATKEIQFSIMFFAASEETLQQNKYKLLLDAANFADRNGFASIWIPERHFATLGGLYPNPSVLHAALAMVTKRIQLRAGSVVLPLHHPLRVAEDWSLVDNLAGGRVGVSFASGWNPDDFAFFPEKYEERWEELFRAIPIVKKLWRGQSLSVTNGIGKQVEVKIYPRPVQPELPTWVTAARSPATFIKAGEIGVNVLTHLLDQDVEDVARKISLYREARGRSGHDPESGLVTMMLHTFVGEDDKLVREQGRKPYCDFLKSNVKLLKALGESRDRQVDIESLSPEEKDDFVNFLYSRFASTRSLIGTPETCVDLVVKLRAMGVDEIACLLDFGPPYELVMKNLTYLNRLREVCTSEDFCQSVASLQAGSLQPDLVGQTVEIGTKAFSAQDALQTIRDRCVDVIPGSEFYQHLKESGLDVHPSIRGVRQIWRRDGEALGEVELKGREIEDVDDMSAALLDSCLQVSLAALPLNHATTSGQVLYIPWELAKVDIRGRLERQLFSHALLACNVDGSRDEIQGEVHILSLTGEPVAMISGLQLRKPAFTSAAEDVVEQWFHELVWEQKPSASNKLMEGTAWLILAEKSGIGRALTRRLEELGDQILLIDRDVLIGDVSTRAVEPEDFLRKVEQSVRTALEKLAGRRCVVVFMWGIDSVSPEEMTEGSLQTDQIVGAGCALMLIRLIAELREDPLPKLWMVTRGGQWVGGGGALPLQIAQAPLWGLGRTCAMEHPELWGGIIDLDPEAENLENSNHLLETVLGKGRENQVAFRRSKMFVPRLVRGRRLNSEPLSLRADASYLITGGLKGIGFEVARWLVRKGARHLYLVGRSPLPARDRWDQLEAGSTDIHEIEKIRALESSGAEVVYAPVDVANKTEMTSFMNRLSEQGPSIRGVIHAASVWRDEHGMTLIRPLAKLDITSLQEVFRPKLIGSWLLHKAFENMPLDFFVCFSSAASLTGSAGQGNYAAASVFQDALAQYRVRGDQRALSINWGPVSGAGFGATPEGLRVHEYWEANGLGRISVEQLLEVLERLLPQSLAQLGVMNVDWEKLGHFFPALGKAPWASYLVQSRKTDEKSDLVERIRELPAGDRQELLVNHLREQVAEVIGLNGLPDPRKKLFEMGMDSLMALELKNRLQKGLATEIRVTAVFNYPTIEALSEYLLGEVMGLGASAIPEALVGPVPEESALSRIKALSEEEVDRLFEVNARKLNPLP